MEGKKTDINELAEKVLQGVAKAVKQLVEHSAKNNEELIVGDKNGNIKSIPAKDLLNSI